MESLGVFLFLDFVFELVLQNMRILLCAFVVLWLQAPSLHPG